jgi:protein SCO1/2
MANVERASRLGRFVAALAVVTLCACAAEKPDHVSMTVNDPPLPTPPLRLDTHDGEPFDLDDHRGEVVALVFGYTSCPDVCPLTLTTLRRTRDLLPEEDRATFQVVMLTTDPERDTPGRMEEYVTRFDPSFIGLSGGPERVGRVLAEWGVNVERQERPDGSYLVTHPSFIIVLDRSGDWRLTVDYLATPEELASGVRPLLAERLRVATDLGPPRTDARRQGGARRASGARPAGAFYLALDDGSVVEVDSRTGSVVRQLLPTWREAPSPDPAARDGVVGAREVAFDPETRMLWYADTHEVIRSVHVDTGRPGPHIAHFSDAAFPGCGVANAARHVSIDLGHRRLIVPILTGSVLFYDLATAELADGIGPAFFGSDLVLGGFRHFVADAATATVWYATSRGDLVEIETRTQRRTGRVIPVEVQDTGAPNAFREMVIDPMSRTLVYQTSDGRLAAIDLETLDPIEFAARGVLADMSKVGSMTYDPEPRDAS